jgi:hypothetical protein
MYSGQSLGVGRRSPKMGERKWFFPVTSGFITLYKCSVIYVYINYTFYKCSVIYVYIHQIHVSFPDEHPKHLSLFSNALKRENACSNGVFHSPLGPMVPQGSLSPRPSPWAVCDNLARHILTQPISHFAFQSQMPTGILLLKGNLTQSLKWVLFFCSVSC